jgi:type IV secretory pathway VirB2 component (pilin)
LRKWISSAAAFAAAFLYSRYAEAAIAGGGAMPWDQGLTTLERDLTGPTPFAIGMIGMAVSGIALITGHDFGRFGTTMCYIILVVCFICEVPNFAAAVGIAGAVVG